MTATRFDNLSKQLADAGLGRVIVTAVTTPSAAIKKACARLGQPCGAAVTDPEHEPTVCCPGLTCGVDGRCVAA